MIRIEQMNETYPQGSGATEDADIVSFLSAIDDLADAYSTNRSEIVGPLLAVLRRRAVFERLKRQFDVRFS
jgi:hypothetical protein